ncbi:hypothetical protein [Clostridium sp. AN503]|uniref:hypothetical protein n=1 Tax=Clostridium sp. AN503 TaxID=3160598 RepID=UPI00345A76B9
MKQKKQHYDDLNCIEQKARELFGYDEDSLLAEMDEAERAWEAEKSANPEAAVQLRCEADEGFAKLMAHIKAKGIQPVSEEEYENEYQRERQKNNRRAIGLGRKRRKVLLLAAAVCVLGLGTTMVVSAHREYKYNLYPVEAEQNVLVKQNSIIKQDEGKLDDVYKQIGDVIGIKVMKLGHIPAEMKFKQSVISSERAIIELEYNGKNIYLTEEKHSEPEEALQVKLSDRKAKKANTEVDNLWLNEKMVIEANILQSGETEFSTSLNVEDTYYSISGIMDKSVFIEIVQGLCY